MSYPLNRRTLMPWKVSFWAACVGAVFVALLFVFPSLRWFPLAQGARIPTPIMVSVIPALAFLWGVFGVVRRKRDGHLRWCVFSLGLSALGIALASFAFWLEINSAL